MNKNTECYYNHARDLHLPVEFDPFLDTLILSLGRRNYFFFRSVTPLNSFSGTQISKNKYAAFHTLKKYNFPVPETTAIHVSEYKEGRLKELIAELSFPLVVKPLDEGLGKAVLCNIQNMEQLEHYLEEQFLEYEILIIQEFHANLHSYRVLVLNNKIIGVILRYPANVIGDGQHNLQELIDLTNIQRQKKSDALRPITVDFECKAQLMEQGIDLSYIPQNGERILLGYTSNASRGGTYTSLGKKICKKNKQLFIRAAKAMDLALVGFDVQCKDINIPIESSEGVIIEANHGPSIRIHEQAVDGIQTPVCKKILRALIYRHPFAYLYTLYHNTRMALYLRGGISMVFVYVIYKLARHY